MNESKDWTTTVEEPEQDGKAPKRKGWKIGLTVFLILICLGAGTAWGVWAYVENGLKPAETGEPVRFTIERGSSSEQIAEVLETSGMIRNAKVFSYYLKFKGEGSRFQAGEYEMTPGLTLDEIIAKLNQGDVVKVEMIRFTIPEGFTVKQIAERIGELGYASSEDILALTAKPQNFMSEAIKEIPDNDQLSYWLEGYLFPETYEMEKGSDAKQIVERMLAELDSKLGQLPEGWEAQLEANGITFHEMMTIASLIEREVVVDVERPVVASVIYNRLEIGQALQIDATVQYALGEQKERLLYEDLEIDSPYNTYKNPGLPPGPIASPSLASIEAALYPAESEYFFYVTKKDGTHEHLFAETYDEHLSNIEKSKQAVAQ